MLIRKTALFTSVMAGFMGAGQVDAAGFGRRQCCQATPIVCPPCTPNNYSFQASSSAVVQNACSNVMPNGVSCTEFSYGARAYCETQSVSSQPEPVSSTDQQVRDLNAAVTSATNSLRSAESEIQALRTQISELKRDLTTVDSKVTVGPGSSPQGVGKAVDDRLPKAN